MHMRSLCGLVILFLVLQCLLVESAPKNPKAPTRPCFTRVRVTVPLDPYGLTTRWKNTGDCTCHEAVTRAHGDVFKPQCNPDGSFKSQQSQTGKATGSSWHVNKQGDQLSEETQTWAARPPTFSSGPYFLTPGG